MLSKIKLYLKKQAASPPPASGWGSTAAIGGGLAALGLAGYMGRNKVNPEMLAAGANAMDAVSEGTSSVFDSLGNAFSGAQSFEPSISAEGINPYVAGGVGAAGLAGAYGLKRMISNKLEASRKAAANAKLTKNLGMGALGLGALGAGAYMMSGGNSSGENDRRSHEG